MSQDTLIRAVTLELSQVSPREFDPKSNVEYFASRGFNTLVVFAIGYLYGEAYYPSKVMTPHGELDGRDLFGEILVEAKTKNLRVFAYVNSFFGGAEFFDPNPDWTARWADGRETTQGRAKGMCLNSPYAEVIAKASAEVCEKYEIDGLYLDEPSLQSWCACRFCKDKFKQSTGLELPLSPYGDRREFAQFLDWRSQCVADFVGRVGQECKRVRPAITYFAQHAFPLSSTSHTLHKHLFWGSTSGRTPPQFEDWYRPSFYGQDIRRVGEHLDMIGIEPWRRFAGYPAWWQGACVNYARAAGRGKPVLPLMEYPHFPWGLGRLSDDELHTNCADVVANGGDLWWPMYAPGAADRGGWDALSTIFGELASIRPDGFVNAAEVGILVSRNSAERFALGKVDEYFLDDLLGTIQIIRELHLSYRLVVDENLTANELSSLRALVAPSAACLTERSAMLVVDYVKAGGVFVAQGFVGTHDDAGQPRSEQLLQALIGARLGPERKHAWLGYLIPRAETSSRVLVRDEFPELGSVESEVLYDIAPSRDLFAPPRLSDLSPGILRNRVGRGVAFAVAPSLGRLRLRYELFEAVSLYGELLGSLDWRVRGDQLGPQVGLHVWSTDSELRVVLVNQSGISETSRMASLANQSVTIAGVTKARSMRGSRLDVQTNSDGVRVTLHELGHWDCIVAS